MSFKSLLLKLVNPLTLITLIILAFYIFVGTIGREPYHQYHSHGWYNLLTDAFLKGQLYFPVKVHEELLKLKDPYDPAQFAPYKLHDMAFYKGKYYLYHGVTPTIILYLPVRLLTGINLPDNVAIIIFLFGGFLFAVTTLIYLQEKYFPWVPLWTLLVSIGVLGLGNTAPFMLKRTMMYEVASSSGYFFLNGGIYFLLRALTDKKKLTTMLILGSLFLGLSIGGRPHLALAGFYLLPLILFWLFKNKILQNNYKLAMAIILPFVFCLSSLALYNYLRFESPCEFGWRFTHEGIDVRNYKFPKLENMTAGIYYYLFRKPIINTELPFAHLSWFTPGYIKVPTHYYHMDTVGMFPGIPFTLLLGIVPLLNLLQAKFSVSTKNNNKPDFPLLEFSMFLIPAILIFLFLTTAPAIDFRYEGDFVTLFIISTCIVWFYFEKNLSTEALITCRKIAVLLAILSMYFGAAFGTEPFFYRIKHHNSVTYAIYSPYQPLQRLLE